MPLKIYNTLTKQKAEFLPQNPPVVKMYTCGVTVYDQCHLGHARSLYIFDVIRRYLKYRGYDVQFVRNITDVDDKIINKAQEQKKTSQQVASENIASYDRDLEALGIARADQEPKATDDIPDMIQHIQGLAQKGFAYPIDGDVYFDVRKFKDYGRLSGQSIDQMLEAVRIEKDSKKKDPLDFALWKKSKPGEPSWASPWGEGRPGWHIECSSMSMKHLKTQTLDIHAGGRDLVFPHHENEIAQSEALTGKPFSRYWIHHGLLTINGQKMAKSLGNFITVQEAISQYGVDNLKLFFLSSHYASPIDFTEEKILEAQKARRHFVEFMDKVHGWSAYPGQPMVPVSDDDFGKVDAAVAAFTAAMDDDFNTPQALAAMFHLVDWGSVLISAGKEEAFRYALLRLSELFGLLGLEVKTAQELPEELRELVRQREAAKKNKDFTRADALRQEMRSRFHLAAVDTVSGITFIELEWKKRMRHAN